MSDTVSVTVTRQDKYRFLVDFGDVAGFVGDEPAPLGDGTGPSPIQLVAAAVANCISSSFVFANAKYKEEPGHFKTSVTCDVGRNEKNRIRILGMKIAITLGAAPGSNGHLKQILDQFEDFCTVSQSVRTGIPFTVSVSGPDGRVIK